ncbi:hypothetical protein [Planomonospora alba]|uniref:hypothetical protein n=1 Tax=Planomonospora alba TaxID=161354 RepID=UPI0031EEB6D9
MGAVPDPAAGGRAVSPQVLLGIVALCYAAAQLLLVTPEFGIEWDEAVYLSQFSLNGEPIFFHASRGWGTPLIVAPVVMITDSLVVVRVYLAIVSALLLFGAFHVWCRVRPGHLAPTAAALFGGCWLSVFYGIEALPNVYTALGAVALTGMVLRVAATGTPVTWRSQAAVAAVTFLVSLFRVTDATLIALALGGAAALMLRVPERRRRALGAIAALTGGLAAGWGLWSAEAIIKYGSFEQRLATASENFKEPQWLIEHNLRALDGPLSCETVERCGPLPVGGLVWLAVVLLLMITGLIAARGYESWIVAATPVILGAGMAMPYLYFGLRTHPRYMMPTLGLWAIAAAGGLIFLAAGLRRRSGVAGAAACCSVLIGGHLLLQHSYLAENVAHHTYVREHDRILTDRIKEIGYGRPCAVFAWNTTILAHRLGCKAVRMLSRTVPVVPRSLLAEAEKGYSILVVYREGEDENAHNIASWPEYQVTKRWRVRIKEGAGVRAESGLSG